MLLLCAQSGDPAQQALLVEVNVDKMSELFLTCTQTTHRHLHMAHVHACMFVNRLYVRHPLYTCS